MALFAVKRFQGDRITETDSKKASQQALLDKLQQKIKAKSAVTEVCKTNSADRKRKTRSVKNKASLSTEKNLNVKRTSDDVNKFENKRRKHSKFDNEFAKTKEWTKTDEVDIKSDVDGRVDRLPEIKKKRESKKKKHVDPDKTADLSNTEEPLRENDYEGNEERRTNETKNEEEEITEEGGGKDPLENTPSFTILGDVENKKKKRVQRVLPDWLAQPIIVDHDIKRNQTPISEMKGLDQRIVARLNENNITHFFPVQSKVIPAVLASLRFGAHVGNLGYRPRDICVSAPTGSGKTLAFVIPVVQALLDRVVPQVRALAVLPTKELADQVYTVFTAYCRQSTLKLALIGGSKSFAKEQEILVRKRVDGSFHSLVDIVVATPGRLVDHINLTEGFTLQHLRFLVIDEADRMMDNISKNWISEVEKSAYPGGGCRPVPSILTASGVSTKFPPLQKLLFSATLSQNPEKLTQLNLFHPELLTSVIKTTEDETNVDNESKGEFIGKFTTPVELTEFMINCTAGEKPLIILHLILKLHFNNVLCFTNTIEETHRLYLLLKSVCGINVEEFSSLLAKKKRAEILKKFKAGKLQILISSDAMARGMDVENVRCVISYDVPPFIKTYIHRVGRTARAGRPGIAFSLVQKSEFTKFKSMLSNVGKSDMQIHRIKRQDLVSLEERYEDALTELKSKIKEEKAAQYAR